MLIDSKIIKSLLFPISNNTAIFYLAEYAERKKDLASAPKQFPFIRDFMVWAKDHGYEVFTQQLVNAYLIHVYSSVKFSYAEVICSYLKSFCQFLYEKDYCDYITFSDKPRQTLQDVSQSSDEFDTESSTEEAEVAHNIDDAEATGQDEDTCTQDTSSFSTKKSKSNKNKKEKLKRVTDYYSLLGVSYDSPISEIRKIYHTLARQIHPDHHPDDPNALKRITSLNMIFSVLKDEESRFEYDVTMGYLDGETRYNKRHYTVWI